MEKKKFNEYTSDEQKELLLQWWLTFGDSKYTCDELNQFLESVGNDSSLMMDIVFTCFMKSKNKDFYLEKVRQDWHGSWQLVELVDDYMDRQNGRKVYDTLGDDFVGILVGLCNLREKTDTSFLVYEDDFVGKMVATTDRKISPKIVCDLYDKCVLTDTKISDSAPEKIVCGEGVFEEAYFDRDILEENREAIALLLDEVPQWVDHLAPSFGSFAFDKDGNIWTGNYQTVDKLVRLGVASGMLRYPMGRWGWEVLPNAFPFIKHTKYDKVDEKGACQYVKSTETKN